MELMMYLFHKCRHMIQYMFSHTIHHLLQDLILHSFHNSGDRCVPIYASRDTDKVYRLPTSNLNADMTQSYKHSPSMFLSTLSRPPLILHCNKYCAYSTVFSCLGKAYVTVLLGLILLQTVLSNPV